MRLSLADLGMEAEVTCVIDVGHAARVRLALGRGPILDDGDDLPLLWHWAWFSPSTGLDALGQDGHPAVQGPLAAFPRRMWAGSEVDAVRPLRVGSPATRRSEVVGTKATSGRTGELVIVTLQHTYSQDGRPASAEQQTLVYRGQGAPVLLPAVGGPPEQDHRWHKRHEVDERTLFRFSAITFNTHRIHYDHRYATGVEGYPDLVVHGPLTAMLLAEDIAERHGPLRSFRFRAQAPLFVGQPFWTQGAEDGTGVAARVVRADGAVAVEATATGTGAG